MMQHSLSAFALISSFVLSSGFKTPIVPLQDLLQPNWATISQIEQAISEVGFFAVTLDENLQQQKAEALKELVGCIHSGAAGKHEHVVELHDETVRSTLATSTNQTIAQNFDADLQEKCPTFVKLSESVRTATAAVGNAYAQMLDKMEHQDLSATMGPFGAAVSRSENLEHFHVYWRRGERKDDRPTLKMHTDLGMFIVMTPPQYFHFRNFAATDYPVDSGFQVQLPNGDVVTPEFPAGSVVVMNGEGCADWINSKVARKLYVPPHQVVLPRGTVGLGRAWYGRMYLPPRTTVKQDQRLSTTFNQYWTDASAALVRAPVGEAVLGHRLLLDQGNCSAGQLYCWMQCMNLNTTNTSNCSVSNIQCKDPSTGTVWQGGNTHCMTCTLVCNATSASQPSPSPSPRSNAGLPPASPPGLLAGLLLLAAAVALQL
eukprot:EG_transcript_7615